MKKTYSQAYIEWKFAVDKKYYTGNNKFINGEIYSTGNEAFRETEKYKVNTEVDVFYNPANPYESVIDRKIPGWIWLLSLMLLAHLATVLLGMYLQNSSTSLQQQAPKSEQIYDVSQNNYDDLR